MHPIKQTKLADDFFRGMRNELTPTKLQILAAFAEEIPLLDKMGVFVDEKHYLQTLSLVLESTAETRHRGYFFVKEIISRIGREVLLLDVGAGNAETLKWLYKKCRMIDVVDSNKTALDNLSTKIFQHDKLGTIHGGIEHVSLRSNYYDLAILSHVLYYIDRSSWLDSIKNLYSSLKVGGIGVIILSDGHEGKAKLMKDFGGKSIDFDGMAKECSQVFDANFEVFVTDEKFHALTLTHMLHTASFFLLDAGVTASKDRLEEYVKANYRQNGDTYLMTSRQKILVLTKKGRN